MNKYWNTLVNTAIQRMQHGLTLTGLILLSLVFAVTAVYVALTCGYCAVFVFCAKFNYLLCVYTG